MWLKSSFSGPQGNCVELQKLAGGVEMRDSKDPDGPTLLFTKGEFKALLHGMKAGEFDHLAEENI